MLCLCVYIFVLITLQVYSLSCIYQHSTSYSKLHVRHLLGCLFCLYLDVMNECFSTCMYHRCMYVFPVEFTVQYITYVCGVFLGIDPFLESVIHSDRVVFCCAKRCK